MTDIVLRPREDRVLKAVIGAYVRTARPVSSGAVAAGRGVGVSPATVRNVMRSLEEMGLLCQPHTSAGRVPTDTGYRYYVDHLMKPSRPTERQELRLRDVVRALLGRDRAALVNRVSRTASELLRELSVAVVPAAGTTRTERVHYEGARYIFRHPDLAGDPAFFGELLDSDRVLADLVRRGAAPGSIAVTIGAENERRELCRVSLVVGSYRVGRTLGHVGIIGSTRMHYPRVVGLVTRLSGMLDDAFGDAGGAGRPGTQHEGGA